MIFWGDSLCSVKTTNASVEDLKLYQGWELRYEEMESYQILLQLSAHMRPQP